ncbi:MAG TPA: D-alanyl-D-alanine carboxypeptidase family protein [Candidatus Binataceae bacterium]|nr:D-alanyl-D-alanine carboxypeptidase family protein [Candidatus Binataceae bacterium]
MGFRTSKHLLRHRYVLAGIVIGSLAALLAAVTVVTPAWARHRTTAISNPSSEEGTPVPALSAPFISECLMEPTTGAVIVDRDMHRQWPTASLAKMMLMLIVARKIEDGSLKLIDRVTTSAYASKIGGSQVYLKEGETFSLDDMMKAVVVHSANDATVAVAEYIAGSTDAFTVMMNQEAARLGLKDTHFYSVDGLPPENGQQPDLSSAYDLAVIARALVRYPDVLHWSSIDTAPFRGGLFELRNSNHLVRTYSGCDGLKTGFYYKAGFNVVATAHRDGMRFIAVVLGSPRKNQNFQLAAELMSQGFADYEMRRVAKQGSPINQLVRVRGGATADVRPVWASSASVLLKRAETKDAYAVVYRLPDTVVAPFSGGQQIGVGEIVVDGKVQQEIPLVAPHGVEQGSLLWRLIGMI